MPSERTELVLASASAVRTRLLSSAGVPHRVKSADIDEGAVRDAMLAEDASHASIAEALAELKAQKIARDHPGAFVLGADQVLTCEGRLFEKPVGLEGVRAHLKALMGKEHRLLTAACIVLGEHVIWHQLSQPMLQMRTLSDCFIDEYVETVGEAACYSVGAYELEGWGAQLFSSIEGDFFDILGLPMLPLLEFLRENQVIHR